MSDLFTLGSEYAGASETAAIFAGIDGEVLPERTLEPASPTGLGAAAGPREPSSEDPDRSPHVADGAAAGSGDRSPSGGRDRVGQVGRIEVAHRSGSRHGRRQDTASGAVRTAGRGGPAGAGTSIDALALSRDGDANTRGGTVDSPSHDGTDSSLLRDLFEGTGVMSALDHAKIEGANEPGARAIEAEAARVAKRATEALRKSRLSVQVGGLLAGHRACIYEGLEVRVLMDRTAL